MPLTARQRSIHNKNGIKRPTSLNKAKRWRMFSEGEFLFTSSPSDLHKISYPDGALAFGLLLTARLASAFWGQIGDCDETFNYWEPLHYLVYGNGLQTWEYSPAYAIRSYMPLWLFALPAKIFSFIMTPACVFYALRVLLAVLTTCSDYLFYKAICFEFGIHVARLWFCLAIPAAGCFASSAAMLPSSWSASLVSAAYAFWWRKRYNYAVMLIAASVFLAWPFTALLGLPIAVDMLRFSRLQLSFIFWSVISVIVILLPTVLLDSWHYGKQVIAPWNIIAYNVFTEHGPDLYGVEPWTYYFVNGFLNFNVVWGLALLCPLLICTCKAVSPLSTVRAPFCKPYPLSLMSLGLWLAVFMVMSHKEERFLYPVYNMILLAAAITLDCHQKLVFAISEELLQMPRDSDKRYHYLGETSTVVVVLVLLAGLGGVSRITAVYNNYHGPMTILHHLPYRNVDDGVINVCYGKDWYRSPSSFHVPEAYRIRFVPSEFNGQLPAPYDFGGNGTSIIKPHFNDLNKGDPSSYLKPTDCHFLVDSDIGIPSKLEPPYHKDTKTWATVASVPLLDAEKSNRIFRAFFLPLLSDNNVFGKLYLLRNKLIN